MREIELSEIKEIKLQQHGWITHSTTGLKDEEVVLVKGVGECTVREITKEFVELWMVKREE